MRLDTVNKKEYNYRKPLDSLKIHAKAVLFEIKGFAKRKLWAYNLLEAPEVEITPIAGALPAKRSE